MANMQRLLGGMLASGMGGRSRRGSAFASGSSFGSFQKTAGLGALAYLAYKAYQEYQKNSPGTQSAETGKAAPGRASTDSGGPSLGERLGSLFGTGGEAEVEQQSAGLGDAQAMLLIRAMIAAANADGQITADERQRIMGKLDQAGSGPEERNVLEAELQNPRSVDQIVREVRDPATAEQVFLASRIAMNPDTGAEKAYLDFLAARLEIPADRLQELHAAI
ncbi:MAG TPA: tellurite resistance TerB family protein [Geminicoccaceae bacterium]|nr:tellurite resistance TerB family protein [Geminicoccaceae bacterium]